jgi:quinol monooxygenase YgiN|nr:putative quinol monooxygenase [Rhizobium giardinii]
MNTAVEKIVRMAELEIDPAQIGAYTALLAQQVEASVAKEPGVLMLHAVSLKGNPERIRILEVYASQQDYEAHLQTPHFLKYKRLTADMVKSLNLVNVDPIVMRAK